MRNFDEIKKTTNRSVFKKAYLESALFCSYCKPNKGCNGDYKHDRSWKILTKKKKQWMYQKNSLTTPIIHSRQIGGYE